MNLNREQLAYELFTLPKYIYSVGNEPRNFVHTIATYSIIENGAFLNPLVLYERENASASNKLDLTTEDILFLFSLYNGAYRKQIEDFRGDFFLLTTLGVSNDEINQYAYYWRNLRELDGKYNEELGLFRSAYEARIAQIQILNQVESFVADEYKLDSKNQVYAFERKATLLDIFDDLQTNKDMPLITTKKYYKVLEGFPYSLDTPEDDETMFLFYKGERLVLQSAGNYIKPSFQITLPAENLSDIKTLLKSTNFKLVKEKLNVIINFNHPEFKTFEFNKNIWADIIMNNGAVSEKFAIDEHLKTFKSSSLVYMYFYPKGPAKDLQEVNKIAFTVRSNNEYINDALTTILTVKLLNCEIDEIMMFSSYISKVFGVYYETADQIVAEYNKYLSIPIKLGATINAPKKKSRLKDIEPELFIAGYKRSCGFPPKIISAEEAKQYEEAGFQTMIFPRSEGEGLAPRHYVCTEKGYEHPGLRVNNLPNKDKFKYLPCCYKEDQLAKDTVYRRYLNAVERKVAEKRYGHIKTEKILRKGQTGDLPPKLKKLMTLVDSQNVTVVRKGVGESTASILECISGRDPNAERKKLGALKDDILTISSQEFTLFGGDLNYAREILRNQNEYLDPRVFFTLLESIYDYKLILLGREDFIFPHFVTTFAYYQNAGRIIIAYENFGGSSEYQVIPQWEIIENVRSKEILYDYYSVFYSRYQVNLFGNAERIDILPGQVEDWVGNVVAQILNSSGQVIALNIKTPPKQVTKTFRLKYPIAPLMLPKTIEVFPSELKETISSLPIVYNGRTYVLHGLTSITDKYSWLREFSQVRRDSKLLIEQAKHLKSRGSEIQIGQLTPVSSEKWSSSIKAPEVIKRKLEYAVSMFEKARPKDLQEYKDYTVIPYKYQYLDDFKQRHGEVVMSTDAEIDWMTVSTYLEPAPVVDRDFYIDIASKVYHCLPRSDRPTGSNVNIGFFNSKRIFKVGNPQTKNLSYLIYIDKNRAIRSFDCFLVSA